MQLSRRARRVLAWLLAACLLFAQTAAVAFACARGDAASAEVVASAPCAAHLASDGSRGAPSGGPLAAGNVCEVHCQNASLPDGPVVDLPSVVVVARWEVPAQVVSGNGRAPAPELDARGGAPPLLALFPRLLI